MRLIQNSTLLLLISFLLSSCASNEKTRKNGNKESYEILSDRAIQKEMINPEIITKLEIKFLEIENCLENSECYKSKIEFNQCGLIENYYPPMVATWWTYEYDNQCRLISETGHGHVLYEYTYLDDDSVLYIAYDISNDSLKTLSYKAKFKLIEEINNHAVYDSFDRLLIDTIGRLSFPCGNDYPGRHLVKYNYLKNGLLESMQYLDTTNRIVVDERYYYSKNDGIRIEFE